MSDLTETKHHDKEIHYHHHINVRGVVIPTWVAILLSIVGLSSSLVVLLAVLVFKNAADDLRQSQQQQIKEIRLIDLHIQDIENILIRHGLAKRNDFATGKEQEK